MDWLIKFSHFIPIKKNFLLSKLSWLYDMELDKPYGCFLVLCWRTNYDLLCVLDQLQETMNVKLGFPYVNLKWISN